MHYGGLESINITTAREKQYWDKLDTSLAFIGLGLHVDSEVTEI